MEHQRIQSYTKVCEVIQEYTREHKFMQKAQDSDNTRTKLSGPTDQCIDVCSREHEVGKLRVSLQQLVEEESGVLVLQLSVTTYGCHTKQPCLLPTRLHRARYSFSKLTRKEAVSLLSLSSQK